MNGNTGYGFAILGFYHPGDEVKPGQYQVKFAITNEKTTFFGDAKKKRPRP
jgi:hypothetical protein